MSALNNIRILDFGRFVAGPYCAAMLADFGADVIRIDRLGGSEDRALTPVTEDQSGDGAIFLQANRNKRSMTLNMQSDRRGDVLRRLIASADVIIANVPPQSLQKMGLDYETVSQIRADIILANISSFGTKGPWAERPGFDSVGQAMCGSAYLTGEGSSPYRTPISWVDHATALYVAFGIMVALLERAATGKGQQIDGSLLGSALACSSTYLVEEAMVQADRQPIGNRSHINGPTDAFRTNDGWIVTQVVGQPIFERWARLVGEPEWLVDPRFASDRLRGTNGRVLSERMSLWCANLSSAEALEALARAGVPAGPVLSPKQALEHPQVKAMELFQSIWVPGLNRSAPLIQAPIHMSESSRRIRRPPPQVGEHTNEVLSELGFDPREIAEFRASGLI